ncbi:MAG: putative binding site:Amine oxidase [Tardiphaga sp.]|nr:putative binding site:Amine oxidase [Tardiphaga sp.]
MEIGTLDDLDLPTSRRGDSLRHFWSLIAAIGENPLGTVRAKAAIVTVSTSVLAGASIQMPAAPAWRHAAALLPPGKNEKMFLEVTGDSPFDPETQVLGNPRDVRTGAYYIRPFGWPVIECFVGRECARVMVQDSPEAGFVHALEELAALFGSDVRRVLGPLIASGWSRNPNVGGAYSCALPRNGIAREVLARPFENRLFFAGEATHGFDFSTAHGAHDSGVRAAEEAIGSIAAARLRHARAFICLVPAARICKIEDIPTDHEE